MKSTLSAILIFALVHSAFSQQSSDATKKPETVLKTTKKSTSQGGSIQFSLGGGLLNPTSITTDSLGFSPMQTLQGEVRFRTKKGWDGYVTVNKTAVVGVVVSGGVLLNESLPVTAASAFNVSGSTSTGLLTEFESNSAFSGYNFEIGPELSYALGDIEMAASVGFGYLKTTQKALSLYQGVSNSAYPALIKIFSRPATENSGFQINPSFRIAYTPSSIGFWIEANYVSGPAMTSKTSYLTPNGRSGADGYKLDQLFSGTKTEIVRKNKFEAFGVNAGVTFALDKKKKPRPKPVGGYDDDCDGLVTVTEEVIMENGNVEKRLIYVQTDEHDSTSSMNVIKNNPLYKGSSTPQNPLANTGERSQQVKNPMYQENNTSGENPMSESAKQSNPGCGTVILKSIQPDGTVEEMTFACPDDAIYFRKQTQGTSFGEKTVEKATSGLKDTLKTQVRVAAPPTTNDLKTKHDTVKNSINNVR